MTVRALDPRRLDLAAWAATGSTIEGRWPLAGFERLAEIHPQDNELPWSARGQMRPVAGGEPQCWLHLWGRASVRLECQRCLKPVELPIEIARSLRFVATEQEAAALDAESEDDVLALPKRLDLHALFEDELLLSLPIVPMHEGRCPEPLPMHAGETADTDSAHPFAALQGLRRPRPQ